MLCKFAAPDFVFADHLRQVVGGGRSVHLRAERDPLAGWDIPKASGRDGGSIARTRLAFQLFCARSDVVHQRRQPPSRKWLALALRDALSCQTAGDFRPGRAVLKVQALDLFEIGPDDLGGARLDFAYGRACAMSLELFHMSTQALQVDIHDAAT